MKQFIIFISTLVSSCHVYATCPTVSAKTPVKNQILSGTEPFEAQAQDDKAGLVVDLYIDGKHLLNTEQVVPYLWSIDTHILPDGLHSLVYQAKDSGGCIVKSQAVSFSVKNSSAANPSPSPMPTTAPTATPSPSPKPTPISTSTPSPSPITSLFPASVPVTGYSTLKPSADSRIIYVSTSGNDSNDGLSPSKPVATPSVGIAKLRHGYPDWVVFKSGDIFNRRVGAPGSVIGRSMSEPVVISRYGVGPRPQFNLGNEVGFQVMGTIKNFVMEGIHIKGKAFSDFSVKDSQSVQIQVGSGMNITFENCFFEKTNEGVVISDGKGYSNVTLRRNIIVDMTPKGSGWAGRVEGIYASKMTGLILAENLFDNNGWNPAIPKSRTVFSHNAYIADTTYNLVASGNIFARGSEDGLKMRRGGIATNNFFILNAIGISINDYKLTGVSTTSQNNVFEEGGLDPLYDYSTTPQVRNYGYWAPKVSGSTLTDSGNIFANSGIGAQGSKAFSDQGSLTANKIYHWGHTIGGTFPDPTRTLGRYNKEVMGGTNDPISFLNSARNQSRENYNPKFSAYEVNSWIRSGF